MLRTISPIIERLAARACQRFGDAYGRRCVNAVDKHGEFIAAEPRHEQPGQGGAQPYCHGGNDLVTGRMAIAIVDQLEVVKIDKDQRKWVAVKIRFARFGPQVLP